MIQSQIEKITPQEATRILENHNSRNRNVSEATVQSYASDMKNGRWTLTHQGLAFDINGTLLDGQHRLWAIVFSNVAIEFMVTRGLPVETDGKFTMDSIDRNRVRTTGQQMQLCHNVKNGNVVAAAMRAIVSVCNPKIQKMRLSTATSLMVYEMYGPSVEDLLKIATSSLYRKSFVLGPLTAYHKGEPDKAREIMTQLMTLEQMAPSVRAIKKFLDTNPSFRNDNMVLRTVCNGIFSYNASKPAQRLSDNELGIQYLIGMFPSVTKRIIDITTPCRALPMKKQRRKPQIETP